MPTKLYCTINDKVELCNWLWQLSALKPRSRRTMLQQHASAYFCLVLYDKKRVTIQYTQKTGSAGKLRFVGS